MSKPKTREELMEAVNGIPSTPRTCAYCGKGRCSCTYRNGRKGIRSISLENVSAQTTAGELQDAFALYFGEMKSETRGAWRISFTEYDPKKVTQ